MNWKAIRLELARSDAFPRGSASRAYLLRLPLDEEGRIDADTLERLPARATVRRFWPNEPDRFGHVVRTGGGWAFDYRRRGRANGEKVFPLEQRPIRIGECIELTEPDGRRLPFRIASLTGLS